MSYRDGQSDAWQRLGMEKQAVSFMELLQQAPELFGHAKGMVSDWIQSGGQAIGPLLLETLLAHGGANATMRGIRHSAPGRALEARLHGMGIDHGMRGETLSPLVAYPARTWLGPEAMAPYDTGSALGKQLAATPRTQQLGTLEALGDLANVPAVRDSAVNYLPVGAQHAMADTLGVRPSNPVSRLLRRVFVRKNEPGRVEKALGGAVAAAGASLHPAVALHSGLNTLRNAGARSELAERFAFEGGLRGLFGRAPTGPIATGVDLAVSPAFLDPQRLGYALHQGALTHPDQVGRAAGAVSALPAVRAGVQRFTGDPDGIVNTMARGLSAVSDEMGGARANVADATARLRNSFQAQTAQAALPQQARAVQQAYQRGGVSAAINPAVHLTANAAAAAPGFIDAASRGAHNVATQAVTGAQNVNRAVAAGAGATAAAAQPYIPTIKAVGSSLLQTAAGAAGRTTPAPRYAPPTAPPTVTMRRVRPQSRVFRK